MKRFRSQSTRSRAAALVEWLRQSRLGFEMVAELADDEDFAGFCRRVAAARRHRASRLAAALGEVRPSLLPRVAGRVHRTWIRLVASAGDAGLADELDRGEAALEKRVRRAVRSGAAGHGSKLEGFLSSLRAGIADTRDEIIRRRADLDWGAEALPPLGGGRRGSSGRRRAPVPPVPAPSADAARIDRVRGDTPVVVTFVETLDDEARARLREFDDRLDAFEDRDARVLAVAPAEPRRVDAFTRDEGLDLTVLSDPNGELAAAVAAVDAQGRPADGTALIDRYGDVVFVTFGSAAESHADDMLDAVDRYRRWFPHEMGVAADG